MNLLKKSLILVLIFIPLTSNAAVTLNVTSNLPTLAQTAYNLGGFIENPRLIVPNNAMSWGMFNEEKKTTYLRVNEMSGNQTYLDIFHDSQLPRTTFCMLDIQLDAHTSAIQSVSWVKREEWQPKPTNRTKPAKCSFSVSGQTINVFIKYTGQPEDQ